MSKHDCPTCTCGLTHVEWSGREGWVDLADPKSVVATVLHCALDHSYYRTGTGVPYGIPEKLAGALAPIVAKHLSAVEPDWENKTVYMDLDDDNDTQRNAFRAELIAAVTKFNAG